MKITDEILISKNDYFLLFYYIIQYNLNNILDKILTIYKLFNQNEMN